MAVKKASSRKSKVKKSAKRAAPRKKPRKKTSTLKRVENAILATMAEVDELALDMGLLGAAPPKKKRKSR